MTNGNDGAYPLIEQNTQGDWNSYMGLTKLEYFAAMAMQGLISSCDWRTSKADSEHANITAQKSVLYAKALINELNKQQ